MPLNLKSTFWLILFGVIISISLLNGCASIQQPTGGPKDSIAPKILKESPKNFNTNFNTKQIEIELDEYIKPGNFNKEASISPELITAPDYKIKKKTIIIKLKDSLESNTTYTINFGKSIADYNEGNILKNYVYVFSTGKKIDSLSISGKVINSITKKPQIDATVFVYPINKDTLFGKRRASIFTTTDSSGLFKLNYLKEGKYKIYALYEKDGGDKIFNSINEEVAFNDSILYLTKNISDIELKLFKEIPKSFKVIDKKINNDGKIQYIFNSKIKNPKTKILSPIELDKSKISEFNNNGDTLNLWTKNLDFDSIEVAIINDKIALDTILIRKSKRDEIKQEINISDNIPSNTIKPNGEYIITFSAPILSIDPKNIVLLQDSIPIKNYRIERDTTSTRRIKIKYPYKAEKTYTFSIPEGSVKGLFGGKNKKYSKTFQKDLEENYGNITIKYTINDTSINHIVQLLNEQEEVVDEKNIKKNQAISYKIFPIGKYYVRVIYDKNNNGIWDTGDVSAKIQPEKIWNSDKEFLLRANWDLEDGIAIPSPQ